MEFDKKEFFLQATLRICSSLDIDKALSNLWAYIRLIIPVSSIHLSMIDPSTGILSNLTGVDQDGSKIAFPPLAYRGQPARSWNPQERLAASG